MIRLDLIEGFKTIKSLWLFFPKMVGQLLSYKTKDKNGGFLLALCSFFVQGAAKMLLQCS